MLGNLLTGLSEAELDNLSQRTLALVDRLYACASVRTLWLRPGCITAV